MRFIIYKWPKKNLTNLNQWPPQSYCKKQENKSFQIREEVVIGKKEVIGEVIEDRNVKELMKVTG